MVIKKNQSVVFEPPCILFKMKYVSNIHVGYTERSKSHLTENIFCSYNRCQNTFYQDIFETLPERCVSCIEHGKYNLELFFLYIQE